jgi:hypothetical protein
MVRKFIEWDCAEYTVQGMPEGTVKPPSTINAL